MMKRHAGAVALVAGLLVFTLSARAQVEHWRFKQEFLAHLVRAVPEILRSQDKSTGRFGKGIWIVTDQNVLWPLAAAWSIDDPGNPHFHSDEVLEAIMSGGDALMADMDERGMWEFRKKDGSTWGPIYMPWTYSRWLRAYGLVRDAMPAERRARWEAALLRGYGGIASRELGGRALNIPAHHAMGLYHAGQLFDRPEWCQQAAAFMRRVADEQDPAGFWSENHGPVVNYNFVYVDALGTYYAMSGDESVRPALERAARFHASLTYPDGTSVETVDERNAYDRAVRLPNAGFTFSPQGRAYLRRQWQAVQDRGGTIPADAAASMILYGREGELLRHAGGAAEQRQIIGDNDAVAQRRGPWFVCLSAYHTPVLQNRWIQDRQNFLSLYHDQAGLIVGGGNTKLQPLWSTFTVGDVSLLVHRREEQPVFAPPPGLLHVPHSAQLDPEALSLRLAYGQQQCGVRVELADDRRARIVYSIASPPRQRVEAHLTLLPRMGKAWKTASGMEANLGDEPFRLEPGQAGEWFELDNIRLRLPGDASVVWPALPHNPYRKDGRSTPAEGRLVIVLPFSEDVPEQVVTVEIGR